MSRDAGRVMGPVASGDSLWTKELPPLVPCCEGKELQLDAACAHGGLSVISVRAEGEPRRLACCSDITPLPLKHRNSFRCVHRPELRRVPGLRALSPAALRRLLSGLARAPDPAPHAHAAEARAELARAASARELAPGLRLHRAQFFTAVLAADADRAAALDTADDPGMVADTCPEDDTLVNEQVQVILRPRPDDEPESSANSER